MFDRARKREAILKPGGVDVFLPRRRFLQLLVFACGAGIARAQAVTEHQLKAAFLLNFARFVEWPAGAFKSEKDPIRIVIVGDDPFGPIMETVVASQTVNGRSFQVERSPSATIAPGAAVVFVAEPERRRLSEILQGAGKVGALTVGDGLDSFLRSGGMINFVMKDRKVRFEINNRAAELAGFKFSSKLLRLAVRVET